jgi:hypothetical protein
LEIVLAARKNSSRLFSFLYTSFSWDIACLAFILHTGVGEGIKVGLEVGVGERSMAEIERELGNTIVAISQKYALRLLNSAFQVMTISPTTMLAAASMTCSFRLKYSAFLRKKRSTETMK